MPDLPTLTVTDEQAGVILEAFKNMYGTTTTEETIVAYKRALAEMIIGAVRSYQVSLIETEAQQAIAAKVAEVNAFFPNPSTIN
jgi:hypothetical protein